MIIVYTIIPFILILGYIAWRCEGSPSSDFMVGWTIATVVALLVSAIIEGSKNDPNDWENLCIKQGGTIEMRKLEMREQRDDKSYYTCTYNKTPPKQEQKPEQPSKK